MQNYFITQHFPVSNHVHKFLTTMHGSDHIQLSRNHFIGIIILNLHSKAFSRPAKRKKTLTKLFKVDISEFYFSQNGLHLNPDHAIIFNDTIDGMFRDEVYKNTLIRKIKDEHNGPCIWLVAMICKQAFQLRINFSKNTINFDST